MMRLLKTKVACVLALTVLAGPIAHASSVFDGTNSDLWLLDESEGRVSGYNLSDWLERFDPGNAPIFPLANGQYALINNLSNSSVPMSPNQPAISIAGLDAGLDGGNPDGHPELLVMPASGDYSETIAVEMQVDIAIMEDDRPTLSWSIDGGAQQSVLLSRDLLQQSGAPVSGGYYTTTVHIARNGSHTVNVTLTEPGALPPTQRTIATEPRTYSLTSAHVDGERRDTDGDGIPDVIEAEIGLDPFSDDWLVDADGDGWSEFDAWLRSECLDPVTQLVIPASVCHDDDGRPVDTDNDGWSDFDEILRGTNHLDPEPTLPVQESVANGLTGSGSAPTSAATEFQSTNFCTDGSTFFLDLRFHAEADDALLQDIILRIGAESNAFGGTPPNQRIQVNIDEAGAISRGVVPEVRAIGTGTPIDRWQIGEIQDFTIESTSLWNWHIYGSVPVGSEPFVPGDTVYQMGIRAPSGDRSEYAIVVSGDPLDCQTSTPPPPPSDVREPTGLDYKDYPAARRLYEVEKIVSGTFANLATEPLPAQSIEAVTVFGHTTYSSLDLLTTDDLAAVQLDAAEVAPRLQASVAASAIAAGQIPVMRLPVSESNVALVEHRNAPLADYSRIYKLWVSQLADVTPRGMFDQPGQPVYASAAEWRDAFVAYLAGTLAIDVSPVQINVATTRDVSLVEGVLSDESRLNNNQRTQLFTTDFGSIDQDLITAMIDAVRRYGGPGYSLDDVASQLNTLTQPGQALQPVGEWIDAQFMTEASGTRSDAFIASRILQSYDSDCYIESSAVLALQADPPAWAEFIARCPDYVTEVDLPDILVADQERRHALRLGFMPGSVTALAADATLLEPLTDSDADNRINTIEINRPLPATTLPWDPDTDGDSILDGDDPCDVDPYNDCSSSPILPGVSIGANIFVSEPLSGSGIAIITVVLDRASDEAITIDYRAFINAGDTAQDGTDFTAITGSVTFAPGERVVIITVPIHADADIEGPETFTVEITGVTGAVVTGGGSIVVTINDPVIINAAPEFVSPASISVAEGLTDTGYTAIATDADNDVLTYGINGGADQAAFNIDTASGDLTFASAPAFDTPGDADGGNDYEVQLIVDDGNGGSDTLDLVVTVTSATPAAIYLEVTYPTANANLGGGVTTTFVRGRIVDPSGTPIEAVDVNYIDVNGQMATLDAGDPSQWSVQVPVIEGDNTLALELDLSDGTNTTANQFLENRSIYKGLGNIVYASGWVFAINSPSEVIRIDVLDPNVQIDTVSGNGIGSGTNFNSLRDIELDNAVGRLLVVDWQRDALSAINLANGDRTDVSSNSVGTGPSLDGAQSLTLNDDFEIGYVATTNNQIIRVDLATGNRTLLSGGGAGSGVNFGSLRSVTYGSGGRLYALDSSLDAIVLVDITSGDRTIISDAVTGTGPTFGGPENLSYHGSQGRILVGDQTGGAFAVDEFTGDRTLLSAPTADYGANGSRVTGIAADDIGSRVFVADQMVDALFAISYSTGERTIITDSATGTADELSILFGIQGTTYDPVAKRLLAIDSYKKYLWGIDLATTHRSILSSDSLGAGPSIDFPGKMTVDSATGLAYMVEQNRNALTAVDLDTGDRTDISGAGVGAGPSFTGIQDVALDIAGNRALVTDWVANALFQVDLASGIRTIVSDPTTGTGPLFSTPTSVVYDGANNRALVLDWDIDMLLSVDLTSGDRSVISDNVGTGTGTAFNVPFDLALDIDNNRVLYVDYGGLVDSLVAIDLTSGDRTVISGGVVGSGVQFSNPYYVEIDTANNRAFVYDVAVTGVIVVDLATGDRAVMAK